VVEVNRPPLTPELHDRYRTADPFPHLVLDGVFGADLCARAAAEYPHPDDTGWHTFSGELEYGKQEGRASIAGYAVEQISEALALPSFRGFLMNLTGILPLVTDPDRVGGGIHQVRENGRLGLHVDYNLHPRDPSLERRVNVILFVADAPWPGADLVLYRPCDSYTRCIKSITPKADRLVIFECGDDHYHGHPDPLEPPTPDHTRKSIPAYYFAPARPGVVARSTTFLENVR
jgi:hypothetical protein